jgi:cupin superfamily acireductone dioxygenase involved in methionine salvage
MIDDVIREIQNRREYVESLLNSFGSGQISQDKLISELAEEFNKSYTIIQSLDFQISQLKKRYEFLINIIISMPEVQSNASLTEKVKKFFPEDSHP